MTIKIIYWKIIGFAIFLFALSGCNQNNRKENNIKIITHEIDSAQEFITQEGIYEALDCLFTSFGKGGSDSNVICLTAITPKINGIGYYFKERNNVSSENFWVVDGDGTTEFYATKADSIFIENQLSENKDKLWIVERFNGLPYDSLMIAKYETNDEINWDQFNQDGYGCFESFSIPIFNVDSTKCIIELNVSCAGTLGSGSSYFLEKLNNEWKVVGHKRNWMS